MTNCPVCSKPAVLFCRCDIGDMMCENKHTFNVDSQGNVAECNSHTATNQSTTQSITQSTSTQSNTTNTRDADLCPDCSKEPKYYCKCGISERICENGHNWYYDHNGNKINGSSHQ